MKRIITYFMLLCLILVVLLICVYFNAGQEYEHLTTSNGVTPVDNVLALAQMIDKKQTEMDKKLTDIEKSVKVNTAAIAKINDSINSFTSAVSS